MIPDTLVVRNTFLEVFENDQQAEVQVRRQHSAPPALQACQAEKTHELDPFDDAPRLPSTPAVPQRGPSRRPAREAWEPPSAEEHEEWLRERNCAASGALDEGLEGRDISTMTALILRNVPQSYTRSDLMDLLDQEGFFGKYDFLYLPVKFGSSCAFGYAMINLIEHQDALRFLAHFQDFCNWKVPNSNKASVSWSKAHQGLAEHVERYRNSPMMYPSVPDDCKPIVLRDGVRVAFPPPTKKASRSGGRSDRGSRHSGNRKKEGSRGGGPGSVSSLASDAGSVSSAASTPAGTSSQLAEPTASPLFQGLTWLGKNGEDRHRESKKSSDTGLYQLTTQMIVGSECSSEQSLRSYSPSQLTSSRHSAPSTCSSKGGRRGYGNRNNQQSAVTWSNTLLAAGLEAAPEASAEPMGRLSQEDGHKTSRGKSSNRWWNPFSSQNNGATGNVFHQEQQQMGPAPLPGSIVEVLGGGSGAAGQQGRILVVDHAKEQYKVQLCDGNIRMMKAKHVRILR